MSFWRRVKQHESLAAVLAAASISFLATLFYYRSWLFHLQVPLEVTGDALQKLQLVIAATRHGWIFENPSVGLPGEGANIDFPRYDSLNYAAIKALCWVLRDPFVSANLYYLIGFPAIAAAACWTFQRMGVSSAWAVVASVSYAWLPYHHLHGFAHFTNGFYVFVPLALERLWRVWHGPAEDRRGRLRWLFALFIVVCLELQNPYYGFFFCVLAVSYSLVLAAFRGLVRSKNELLEVGVLVGSVCVVFALEQLPRLLFEHRHGKNLQALVRLPSGPSDFALSFVDLVNPSPDHPLAPLAGFTRSAAEARGVAENERIFVSLPVVALVGCAVALFALARRARRLDAGDGSARIQQRAGVLILLTFACCHEGGLCTLLSEAGFHLVRAWNRMVVFLAFAAFVAAGAWLDAKSRRLSARGRTAAIAFGLVLVLAEQLPATPRTTFTSTSSALGEAQAFTKELAGDDGFHRAFILPHVSYPETGSVAGIREYDHLIFLVASPNLGISYGAMRGRGGHYFSDATLHLGAADLLHQLREGEFDRLIVDQAGPQTPLVGDLERQLGAPAARTRRFLGWRIALPSSGADQRFRAYPLGTELDFARDASARRYLELNFAGFEAGGTWTLGRRATLRLRTAPLPERLVLQITGRLYDTSRSEQRVELSFDGQPICTLDTTLRNAAAERWECSFQPGPGASVEAVHELRFDVALPVRPSEHGKTQDARPLGLRLETLRLSPAP